MNGDVVFRLAVDALSPPMTVARLTSREHEILAALSTGADNRDLALMVGVSEHTIKFHVCNLIRKLAPIYGTRAEVITNAFRQGLLK
jgi:two-component system nitrate/nitrite response regulator NarL